MKLLKTERQIESFLGVVPLQSVSIRITQGCNLHCLHCYASGGTKEKNELNYSEVLELLKGLKKLGVIRIFFTGGEPFLRKDFIDILKSADKLGFSIYLSTNGTLLTEANIRQLKSIKIKRFQVSIDGVRETHDVLRGMTGAFDLAIKNIKLIRKLMPKLPMTVAMTLTRQNQSDVQKLRKVVEDLKIDDFAIIPMITIGRGKDKNVDISSSEKLKIFQNETRRKSNETKLSILCSPGVIPNNGSVGFGCGFVCTFPNILGIAANGDVYPCDGLIGVPKLFLGNIRQGKLEHIWQSQTMKKLRSIETDKFGGVCKNCRYLDSCAGGCRANSYISKGDFFHSDPLCQSFYDQGLFPKGNII